MNRWNAVRGLCAIGLGAGCAIGLLAPWPGGAVPLAGRTVPVQMPYEMPPKPEGGPDTSVPPNTAPLSEEERKRAEALLPMLEGKQELWAIGEFVHLGPGAIPVLVKALNLPGPRARYNAIETLSMIKEPSAVPALLESAKQPNELPRIREHALRVAVRLDPSQVAPAIEVMAKDPNSTIRKAAAFEARHVRSKAVVPVLITLVGDHERFVGISAVQSLWALTRHATEMHDWEVSSQQDREEWAKEWTEWWETVKDGFEFPEPRRQRMTHP